MINSEYLRSILHYDPETGEFTWICPNGTGKRKAGRRAGWTNAEGYRAISIDGKTYYGHHLAWFYVFGEWPSAEVDHRDKNQGNNAIKNLREATGSQNNANKGKNKNNTTGFKGVVLLASGRYRAAIGHNRKLIYLGCFDRAEDASEAYAAGAQRLYGEFARAA